MTEVDVIRDMLVRAQREPEALRALLADDVVWEFKGSGMPDEQVCHGPDGVMAFFRRWVGAFEEWGYDALEVSEAGSSVIANIRQWGIGKSSGARVEQNFWATYTFRAGKIVHAGHYADRAGALGAA